MLRIPSRRKSKKRAQPPNLISILDSVFIFIFFLLMSTSFVEFFEIQSPVPIVSSEPPPKNQKKPLGLLVQVLPSSIKLFRGAPPTLVKTYPKTGQGKYDLEALHDTLVSFKQKHVKEKTIILEPLVDLSYQEIINIMDSVRQFRTTDPTIMIKDKDNMDKKVRQLFSDIIFANIQS